MSDEALEQVLWEANAAKCENRKHRIAFCRAYLNKYANPQPKYDPSEVMTDPSTASMQEENTWNFRLGDRIYNLNRFYCKVSVSDYDLRHHNNPSAAFETGTKNAAFKIAGDILEGGLLSWEVQRNLANQSNDYIFKLGVVKL
jgi:hypothetical protein